VACTHFRGSARILGERRQWRRHYDGGKQPHDAKVACRRRSDEEEQQQRRRCWKQGGILGSRGREAIASRSRHNYGCRVPCLRGLMQPQGNDQVPSVLVSSKVPIPCMLLLSFRWDFPDPGQVTVALLCGIQSSMFGVHVPSHQALQMIPHLPEPDRLHGPTRS
jgi:hypothetical protein